MVTLTIDAEFQSKIPPLTEAEFQQLKENILEAGEVYEPIVVWNGVIVDGHNRWKIVQEHPEITYRVREMEFADKWAAFDWMYKNQLGRRNLTEQQRTTLIGQLGIARMQSRGGDRGNQYTKLANRQNGGMPERQITSDQIAKELGIGSRTVDRAISYAKGINAISNVSPDTANRILNGEIKVTKHDVASVAKASPTDIPAMIESIRSGRRVNQAKVPDKVVTKPTGKYTGGGTKEYREQRQKIAETAQRLYDPEAKPEYTLGSLADEIRWNAESFVKLIANLLNDHHELVNANKEAVKSLLEDQIINKFNEIKEEIDK